MTTMQGVPQPQQAPVMQPQVMSPQPQFMYTMAPPTNPGPTRREKYKGKTSVVLGALQVTVGILCIIFQVTAIAIEATAAPASSGIYCGVLFIIAGAFGICAGKKKTNCFIITFMIMSIISACFVIAILSTSAIGIAEDSDDWDYRYYPKRPGYYDRSTYNDYNNYLKYDRRSNVTTMATTTRYYYDSDYYPNGYSVRIFHRDRVAMNIILLLLAIFEVVIAIWSSAICCAGVCCTGTPNRNRVLYGVPVQYAMGSQAPGQVVFIQQPAHMNYPQMSGQTFVVAQPGNMPQNVGVPQPINIPGQQATYAVPNVPPSPNSPPSYAWATTEVTGGAVAAPLPTATPAEGNSGAQKQEEAVKGEAYNPNT